MTAMYGTPVYDECEEYDRTHGKATLADEQKAANLSEAANKPSPHPVSFKITLSK
jgi:hypothetical protein